MNGPEGILTTFKDLGSYIAIYDEIIASNLGIQNKLVASIQQQDYDYGTVQNLSTLINNQVSASNNLNTAEANIISSVTNYLITVLAPDIVSSATTASGVLADLIWVMQGSTQGTPSGVYVLLSGHFHTFFLDEFGIGLPVVSGAVLLSQAESMSLISGTLPTTRRQIPDSYGD